ncbi:hypothetical protein [Paraburkholderia nodosa]|uniref:hypothetical protein n=1 Tax=Paraburkholderia nodosa TaxID=392320 RepID=UPI0008422EB8|nr:hypothetical protein [Paraburkholderia nodosa]
MRNAKKGCEPLAARLADLMEDGKERTVKDCGDALNRSRKTVQRALHELSQEGPMQQIHICRRDGNVLVYVNGPGKNVAVKTWRDPARAARRARATEAAQTDHPTQLADTLLVECMRRMVSCGAPAIDRQQVAA